MPRPQETAPLIRRSRSGPPPSSVPTRAPLPSSPSPNLVHRSTQLPTQVKRAPSVPVPSSSASQQQLDPAKQKLVERAIKARLYLLYKSGPNRFLVGGDVPDSRFYVTIGPQVCVCTEIASPCNTSCIRALLDCRCIGWDDCTSLMWAYLLTSTFLSLSLPSLASTTIALNLFLIKKLEIWPCLISYLF